MGHTDFEVCSPVSQKAKQCAVEEGQRERTVHTAQKVSVLLFLNIYPPRESHITSQIGIIGEDKDGILTVIIRRKS